MRRLLSLIAAGAISSGAYAADSDKDDVICQAAECGCPIAKAFLEHDADDSGTLCLSELKASYLATANDKKAVKKADKLAKKFFKTLDADSDDAVTKSEYKTLLAKIQKDDKADK